jgi:predicted PhzF superfamily epimerase YddE/YHI9
MAIEIQVVDAFTDQPFKGNPAAVAVVSDFPPVEWMQAVALEMNLSETAFVVPEGEWRYRLRWFTPVTEVDLCGHATLASAHVVGGGTFSTRSGDLPCRAVGGGRYEMSFPADPARPVDEAVPSPDCQVVGCYRGRTDLLVEVEDEAALRSWDPDMEALRRLEARTVVYTAAGGGDGVDFVSRVFGPRVGVPEDPVTGSAHCTLAVHWSKRLGRDSLTGFQASKRGGTVGMRLEGDRVLLQGAAVTVSVVRLLVDPPNG